MLIRIAALLTAVFLAIAAPPEVRAQSGNRGLLWEVTSSRTTVYLLGTIHVGDSRMYPLPPHVEKAYASASAIALEADLSTGEAMLAAAMGAMYVSPDSLDQHVPPELFRNVTELLRSYGLPVELGRSLKPHMLAMALTMMEVGRAGLDASLGLDLHLAQRAHRDGKKVMELESIGQQMQMLDGLPADAQVAMLEATVQGIRAGTLSADMTSLVEAWRKGEAEKLDEVAMRDLQHMPPATARSLKSRLYDERNRAMADRIAQMLDASEVVLVAVGAGHMTGPEGLVALLKARGFAVRRL